MKVPICVYNQYLVGSFSVLHDRSDGLSPTASQLPRWYDLLTGSGE